MSHTRTNSLATFVLEATSVVILISSLFTFFFRIAVVPTNSMFPTVSGVHVIPPTGSKGLVHSLLNGSMPKHLNAPYSGEVIIPVSANGLPLTLINSHPLEGDTHCLLIGRNIVKFSLPFGTDISDVLLHRYFPHLHGTPQVKWHNAIKTGKITAMPDTKEGMLLHTGKFVSEGQELIAWEQIMGDIILIDLLTPHFTAPRTGEPLVFALPSAHSSVPKGTQFLKRLMGKPGDTLTISDSTLYTNDTPNTRRSYVTGEPSSKWSLAAPYTVPPAHFFALGDNTHHSADSRTWGPVPITAYQGRAFFILYPRSSRQGPIPLEQ